MREMISMTRLLESTAAALVLAGVWLIGTPDILGQYLMLAAQVLWLAWAVRERSWGLAVQSVILAGLTVRAIVIWSGIGVAG